MSFFDRDEGRRLRDIGMANAEAGADRTTPDFSDNVIDIITDLPVGSVVIGDVIWHGFAERGFDVPPEKRALGPAMKRAEGLGLVCLTDEPVRLSDRPEAHRKPQQVWRRIGPRPPKEEPAMIPVDLLGGDQHRRDRWGRLLVVPPGNTESVGYTRATTIAKVLDEGGGLIPWKATMAVVGTLRRPGIRATWESLIAASGDPWYFSPESKAKCRELVEEAAEAGGSTNRAEQGTALHAITALIDSGAVVHEVGAETMADLAAYTDTLAAYGIEVLRIETTVVLDTWQVGGTFDRIVRVPGYELPLIADLKTGSSLDYSWQSFAVQLAIYAHGEAIYDQGPTAAEDERHPMPEVDQHTGLIIWLPAGEARCELHVVDLDAGWEGFEMSMAVRQWRKRRDFDAPLSVWEPRPVLTVVPAPEVADVRQWLQGRINLIGKHSGAAVQELLAQWPEGVPCRALGPEHDDALDLIEKVLDNVEGLFEMPFGASRPGPPLTVRAR
jgi:hypothetical protein